MSNVIKHTKTAGYVSKYSKRQRFAVLPYAALVFCAVHWLSPHAHAGWECPLSEPSLPCEARLQSHPEDQAGTCPDGCASPAAAIDIY